jgi:hypothetical protein
MNYSKPIGGKVCPEKGLAGKKVGLFPQNSPMFVSYTII